MSTSSESMSIATTSPSGPANSESRAALYPVPLPISRTRIPCMMSSWCSIVATAVGWDSVLTASSPAYFTGMTLSAYATWSDAFGTKMWRGTLRMARAIAASVIIPRCSRVSTIACLWRTASGGSMLTSGSASIGGGHRSA